MAVLFLLSFFLFMATKCQSQTAGCPSGFLTIGNGCYLAGDVPVTWTEAKQFCFEKSSYLATIETCEENGALLDAIIPAGGALHRPEGGKYAYWTSGSDTIDEGDWIWMTTGGPITCSSIWADGQPSNGGGITDVQNCLVLSLPYEAGDDISCDGDPNMPVYALCEVNFQASA